MGFFKKKYNEVATGAIDLETLNAFSAVLDVSAYLNYAVSLVLDSGAITTGILTVQISDNGTTFVDTATTINTVGIEDKLSTVSRFVRLRVSTANDAAGVVSGKIMAKE